MNKWGVGFIPSYNPKKTFLTDIDDFVCDLSRTERINGLEYVKDEKGFSHPLGPFIEAMTTKPEAVPFDTVDCRSQVFDNRKAAMKHADRVMATWYRPPKHIDYYKFDEDM